MWGDQLWQTVTNQWEWTHLRTCTWGTGPATFDLQWMIVNAMNGEGVKLRSRQWRGVWTNNGVRNYDSPMGMNIQKKYQHFDVFAQRNRRTSTIAYHSLLSWLKWNLGATQRRFSYFPHWACRPYDLAFDHGWHVGCFSTFLRNGFDMDGIVKKTDVTSA